MEEYKKKDKINWRTKKIGEIMGKKIIYNKKRKFN